MLQQDVARLVTQAASRLERDIRRSLPLSADRLLRWPGPLAAAHDNLQPLGYPIFYFPVWAAGNIVESDATFHEDISYSTLSGLCFVRLIDDVADADKPSPPRNLVQSAGFFHARFQSVYHRYFAPDHPFWSYFSRLWDEQTDFTVADANLGDVSEDSFAAISARKTVGALIPLIAGALRSGHGDAIDRWTDFVVRLGALQQMTNDILGFGPDLRHGVHTFLTSQFRRRRKPDEAPSAWLAREGRDWVAARLAFLGDELAIAGNALANEDVARWLAERRQATENAVRLAGQAGWSELG